MRFDATARDGVAPLTEKQSHRLPADGFFLCGAEKVNMTINPYHAQVIDRLREAAKEHGAVADLLECIASSFPYFCSGETSFHGCEESRAYFIAALNAASFVAVDRGVMEEGDD